MERQECQKKKQKCKRNIYVKRNKIMVNPQREKQEKSLVSFKTTEQIDA